MPRDGSQTAFQEARAEKNIGRILSQASNEKNKKIQAFYFMRSLMINPVTFICPSPHPLLSPAL